MDHSSHHTNKLIMSVWHEQWAPDTQGTMINNTDIHSALWLQSGLITINGKPMAQGSGCYLEKTDQLANLSNNPAVTIRVSLATTAATNPVIEETAAIESTRVSMHAFTTQLKEAVLRFDQVDFPAGAIAYRHTHPGAGVRYLVDGGLQLETDHGRQQHTAGEAWFEAANSPVKATAIRTIPSRFIRLMLLPVEFEGHPTLTLLNAEDADKPRLQTNTRHFDKRVVV